MTQTVMIKERKNNFRSFCYERLLKSKLKSMVMSFQLIAADVCMYAWERHIMRFAAKAVTRHMSCARYDSPIKYFLVGMKHQRRKPMFIARIISTT